MNTIMTKEGMAAACLLEHKVEITEPKIAEAIATLFEALMALSPSMARGILDQLDEQMSTEVCEEHIAYQNKAVKDLAATFGEDDEQ